MSDTRPEGSGWFSIGVGVLFAGVFVASLNPKFWDGVDPYRLFQGWLVIAATLLILWGTQRVMRVKSDWRVGQDTINFVVAFTAAAIALFTLVAEAKREKATKPIAPAALSSDVKTSK